MAYRSDTQLALDDLNFLSLQQSLAPHAPANQHTWHAPNASSTDPEEAEHWLRWMKISLGCETG